MKQESFVCRSLCVMFCALIFMSASCVAQSVLWDNKWTVLSVPSVVAPSFIDFAPNSKFVTTSTAKNGDVLVGKKIFGDDFRLVRMSSTGHVRWSVSLPDIGVAYENTGFVAILPTEDGGGFISVGNPYDAWGSLLIRINADGTILWERQEAAGLLVRPTDQAVVLLGCCAISQFDAATGAVDWKFDVPDNTPNHRYLGGLVTDGLSNVYATVPNAGGFDALKLDSTGHVVWQVTVDVGPVARATVPVAATSTRLFLNTSNAAVALSTSDGSTAWNDTQASIITMAGSPTTPVVVKNGTIQRLTATNGIASWTQTFAGVVTFAQTANNEILLGSGNSLTSLAPDTGTTLWSASIPAQDDDDNALDLLVASADGNGNIMAIASAGDGQSVFLQPIDSQTGQLQTPPTIAATLVKGVQASNLTIDQNGHIASVARNLQDGKFEIRLRSLDSINGATLWEAVQPLNGQYAFPEIPALAASAKTIAVAVAANHIAFGTTWQGYTWVRAFDEHSGNLRWARDLQDPQQGYTYASSPAIDEAGDIYVAYGTYVPCAPPEWPQTCFNAQQTLIKLSHEDGSTLWRFDNLDSSSHNDNNHWPQLYPQDFVLAGNNVVVSGPFFSGLANHDVINLAGDDGAIRWTMDDFGGAWDGLTPLPDGGLIGIGTNEWIKVDADSGAVEWTNTRIPQLSCNPVCTIYDKAVTAQGDIFLVGEGDFMPLVDFLPAGQGAVERRFRLDTRYTGLRSLINRATVDSAGRVWLGLTRYFRAAGLNILAQLDTNTGALMSQQILNGYHRFPFPGQTLPFLISAPENHRLEALSYHYGPPISTATSVVSIDTSIVANGDLSIQVATDHAVAHSGDVINFHVVATYNGNAAVAGVHLIADLSRLGLATDLSCVGQAAANCILDSSLGVLKAVFDVQPGGQIYISGKIAVSMAPIELAIPALVYGPVGLSEHDTLNNFTKFKLTDEIFSDGF